jgi:hypothetical protein
MFTYSSTADEPCDQIVDEPLTQTPNETENRTTSQVLCENTPTNSMPSKKHYKKRIYGVDEIDKKHLEHLDKISASFDSCKATLVSPSISVFLPAQ